MGSFGVFNLMTVSSDDKRRWQRKKAEVVGTVTTEVCAGGGCGRRQ